MRRAAKVDANQAEIIKTLRSLGASVQPLHMVGEGCPDLLVGWKGRNYLLEVKDGSKSPSRRKLTEDQTKWHAGWKGSAVRVDSAEQAAWVVCGIALYNIPEPA